MKRFVLLIWASFVLIILQAATVTFNTIYLGTRTDYTINSNAIDISTAIVGSDFKFTSANPADVTFSGNNVAGQLSYYSGGMKILVNGVISRKVGNSNNYSAFFFAETTVLGGNTPTGKAYLFIVPGKTVSGTSVSTNSAPVNGDLNDFLTVQSGNNNPPVITSDGGGSNAYISINEGITAVTTVTSTDALKGTQTSETKVFSISGGVDASKFTINSSTGALTFVTAPDYENPTDAGLNNIYDVQITVTDSQGATDVQQIAVTILDLNDNTPNIISNGGLSTASINVVQNTTAVTTVIATDADYGDVLTYSISGGANAALFSINQITGVLTFNSGAAVGTYTVAVRATDAAGHYDTQTITVNVSATDQTAPTLSITSSDNNLSEGESCIVSFKFSEPVQGFSLSDVSVAGGNLTNLQQSEFDPTQYYANFTQSGATFAPEFIVANGSYTDLNNNSGIGSSLTLSFDIVPPTVAVSFGSSTISFGESELVIFTFSENPGTSFTTSDIQVQNANLLSLVPTANPLVWNATIMQTSAVNNAVVTVINQSYTDPAGNVGSSGSASITVVPPTIDLENTPTSDTGASSSDNITSNKKPIITGYVESGIATVTVTVQYYESTNLMTLTYNLVPVVSQIYSLNLNTTSPSAGTMPSAGLPDGYVSLMVTTPTSAVATNQFLIDTTVPAVAPTANALSTYDATPTLTGTATLAEGETLKVTVNGVNYYVGDGNLTFNGSVWTLTIPFANKLSPATYPVTATVTDLAGNSRTGSANLTINNSTLTIDLANTSYSDTGSSSTDNITSNRKPIITGTSVGSDATVKVVITANGVVYTYNSVSVSLNSWSLDLSSVQPSSILPTGTFPAAGLPTGTVQLLVEGNTSGATGSNSFVIDYTAPATPTVNSDTTNDTTPAITGTATVNAGDVLRVVINGVTYTNGDGRLSYSSGTWTLNIPGANALTLNTAYPTTVSVTDLAGNVSSGNGTITITNATVTIDLEDTPTSDTGDSSTDNYTTNRKPILTGTSSFDNAVNVVLVNNGISYYYNNIAVSNGNWSLNLNTITTSVGPVMPSLGFYEGIIDISVAGVTSGATDQSQFEIYYTTTSVADGTWTTNTKWDSETNPNTDKSVAVLKHNITIPESQEIVCKDIEIESGASLTNNASLTIKENLILKVGSNNQSSSIVNKGNVVNQGKVIIRKTFRRDFGWYFMSFPFNVTADKIFIAGTNTVARWGDPTTAATSTNDFYVSEYDGAKRDATGIVNYVVNSPNWKDVTPHTFIAKKGYIVAVPGDIEIDFVSAQGETSIFNPNSSVGISKYTANQYQYHNSWNLIGIPYASSYRLNTASQAPFYSYNKNSSNYDVIMTSDDEYLINPYYSFFMQAGSTQVDFASSGRVSVRSKMVLPTYDEINLSIKNDKYSDLTRIRLEQNASTGYVIGSDAIKMFSDVSAVPQIYTFIGNCASSYNTLPRTTSAVDLTTKIGVKGNYSIVLSKAWKASGSSKIILVDNVTGTQQDLLQDSVYNFYSEVSTSKRFKVLFTTENVSEVVSTAESDLTLSVVDHKIRVDGLESKALVKIFDLNGKLLNTYADVENGQLLAVSKGMLLVNIIQNEVSKSFKINLIQ